MGLELQNPRWLIFVVFSLSLRDLDSPYPNPYFTIIIFLGHVISKTFKCLA